ncbi:MAG: hypothetical protein K5705_11355 [Oscillospiraceae bacterium]|nr:hypothetical protein [Oscillospiraceae bacterium]MCR4760841.1 hypothetical protein [Oscillospiraceae bacterium]
MTKKLLAALAASVMVLTACTACGKKDKKNTPAANDGKSAAETSSAEDTPAAEDASAAETQPVELEERVAAAAGDAVLCITDSQWYVKYFGTADDLLSYGAGAAHISGDGDYTVSVNVGSKGAQQEITGDPSGSYQCEGIDFAAVKVFDGTVLYPKMCIEIKEIRVDGKPVQMTAKNYTSSDDGTEMRANIYNHFVSKFPDDAHTAEGPVTGEFGEYSSETIDPASFAKWSKVEVDFTVTGTGK